jgi:capsular polysaccharide transport system permease protein
LKRLAVEAEPGSLLRSLRVQWRVIRALLMREVITRYGRENLGVLWLIAEPAMFTLGVSAMWSAAGMNHGSSLPIVAFAITGYSSVLMWRNTVSRCNSAIIQNFNLLYHRNVHVIDVLVTRIILEMAGTTASFTLLLLFFVSIDVISPPVDMLQVIGGWLMLTWFGASLGLVLGAATTYSEIVDRIWHPTSYLLFPLSGAAFMVEWLPPRGQEVVLLLPMVHGVELLREGYFGDAVRTHHDAGYMALCCLMLTLVGLVLVRDAGRRVEAP